MSSIHTKTTIRTLLSSVLILMLFSLLAYAQRGGPPRRIEDPQTLLLEGGSRVEFRTFRSEALGTEASYSVFLPPSYDSDQARSFPTIYFLHGLFNDHTSWAVERYGNFPAKLDKAMTAKDLPEFVMIHPKGDRGFYTDVVNNGPQYEQYVYRDMMAEAEKRFRLKASRAGRAIAGTSMGGYGALKIAMKYPELFASVAAGSPIVFLGEDPMASLPQTQGRFAQYIASAVTQVFGNPVDQEHWRRNSVEELARRQPVEGLGILFFHGTADRFNQMIPLEKGVKTLDSILTERGIPHSFEIVEDGAHGWELVGDRFDEMTRFLSRGF